MSSAQGCIEESRPHVKGTLLNQEKEEDMSRHRCRIAVLVYHAENIAGRLNRPQDISNITFRSAIV